MTNRRRSEPAWLLAAVAVVAILLVYGRAVGGSFLWDDDAHVSANPTIIGPQGLKEIWTSGEANYFPLTMTSFWLQHAAWGLRPAPYHVVTLLCHVLATLALWRVLVRLAVPGAWLGAMLWALHPVQVESVAWICELKNTQSACFYLLTIYLVVRWLQRGEPLRVGVVYVLAVLSALLATLSKSSTVVLPAILGLIGWWQGRRAWRDLRWLVPFVAIAAVASGWTVWEQKYHSMALGADWSHGWAARLVVAGKTPWFYLGKLVWPNPLVFIYPRWDVAQLVWTDFLPLIATTTVAVAVVVMLVRGGRSVARPVGLALAIFGISLSPVLGLFDVYFFRYSFVGDHLQYLASMGPLALAGAALAQAAPIARSGRRVAGVVLLGFAFLTIERTAVYRSSEVLWRDTIARNPQAWIAHNNLGTLLTGSGRTEEGIDEFKATLQLRPEHPEAHANLGSALVKLGRFDEAEPHLAVALAAAELRRGESYPELLTSQALLLLHRGRAADAVPVLETALRLKPRLAEAENTLGVALRQVGRNTEARAAFDRALAVQPQFPAALFNRGDSLASEQRWAEAAESLRAGLQLAPGTLAARRQLGGVLLQLGQPEGAAAALAEVVRADPRDTAARIAYVAALVAAGHRAEATRSLEEGLTLAPDDSNLARLRAELSGH